MILRSSTRTTGMFFALLCALCVSSTRPAAQVEAEHTLPQVTTLPVGGQRARALGPATALESRTEFELPELGLTLLDVRRVLEDGSVERFGFDTTGAPVDVDALRRADHALGHARRGKLAPHLAQLVADSAAEAEVEVAFWLREDPGAFDARRQIQDGLIGLEGREIADALHVLRPWALARADEQLTPSVTAFAGRVEASGGTVLFAGRGWPLVIARLPAGVVLGLASATAVDEAYWSRAAWMNEGEFSQSTMRTYNVHDAGVLADGSVRVFVNDTAQVYGASSYLPPIVMLNSDTLGIHSTGVAGNIANSHPDDYAASFSLPELYSASGTGDVDAPLAWELGLQAGIDFGNCSWWNGNKGGIVFLDRFFDYTIRKFGVMMFKSTGNQGVTGTPYATTPGNGYNMLCTGNYDEVDSAAWDDDTMVPASSYWNPVQGHEKPEVASPGACVSTTTTSPLGMQSCFGGTSSASPLTCGVATLVASGTNALLGEMTTVKAMLMASAWHNVEGAALLSDKDGAGAVHAWAAQNLAANAQWWYDDVVDADFVGGILDVTLPLVAGDETRVCALWFSNPNSAYATDVLEMDVDLAVLAPGGALLAMSASALNPFELASFIPPVTGSYTVRLTKQRFDGLSEPLTVAWSSRSDSAPAQVRVQGDGDLHLGVNNLLRIGDRYTGAGSPFLLWASLQGPQGFSIAPGQILPAGVDALALATLAIPGFGGTLDAEGWSVAVLPLPNQGPLAGLLLHFGLLVLDFTDPDGVRSMSAPVSISIQ